MKYGRVLQRATRAARSYRRIDAQPAGDTGQPSWKGFIVTAVAATLVVLVVVAVIAAIGRSGNGSPSSSQPSQRKVSDSELSWSACETAKKFVKAQLKAPSTAKFPNCQAVYQGGGNWNVTGYVDAENSFSAKLRSSYTVVLHQTGAGKESISWRLVNISIN